MPEAVRVGNGLRELEARTDVPKGCSELQDGRGITSSETLMRHHYRAPVAVILNERQAGRHLGGRAHIAMGVGALREGDTSPFGAWRVACREVSVVLCALNTHRLHIGKDGKGEVCVCLQKLE